MTELIGAIRDRFGEMFRCDRGKVENKSACVPPVINETGLICGPILMSPSNQRTFYFPRLKCQVIDPCHNSSGLSIVSSLASKKKFIFFLET
jgi:hypothetical protein